MKNTIIFSSIFFCILFSVSASQQFPVVVTNINNEIKCSRAKKINYFDTKIIIDSIKTNAIADTAFLACCYHQLAVEYYLNYDNINSIKYNKLAKHLRAQFNDGLYWRTELNLGINFFELNEFSTAVQHLKKAYQLKGFKRPKDSISILKNIAESYAKLGEYETALEFGQQAIQVNASIHKKNEALNTFTSILIQSNDPEKIKKAIELADKAYQSNFYNNDKENLIIVLNNLGHAHDLLGKFERAIQYYEEALNLTKEEEPRAILLNDIATILTSQKKYLPSIIKLEEAFAEFNESNKYNYHFYIAINENLADNYVGLGKIDSALIFYQKALSKIMNINNDLNIFENPNLNDSLFIYSNPDMIRVLHLKATAAYKYYQQNKNEKYLNLANQTYQTAFDFHDKLQKDISTENSRLFQAKNIVPYIENALKVAYQLQENGQSFGKTAFRFMEKNKATVLLQSMNEADALQFANLPDSIIEQEKELKIARSFYKRQLNEAKLYEDTITLINNLENTLFENKEKYRRLINNLEENHPNYYRLKYQQNQTQLEEVQKQLNDQTALLSYFVGDSSIYTLLILKDSSQLFKIKKPADWEAVINNFQETISLSNRKEKFDKYNKQSFIKFVNNGQALYQYLLEEPLKGLDQISNLKIIPDAALNYIPFDLLLTNTVDTSLVDYLELPYLLKQKTISYAYSAALMMEQQQAGTAEKDYAYGGYAPKYDNSTYSDLPKARQLVNNMASFFKGKKHLNNAASKANFLKDSINYQILHLAMHGKLNDQYPLNSHLVFTKTTAKSAEADYKLYAADLYLQQLNADLTILNACETGSGKLRKGEGVMSLSRAFTYAGCPSLMMSLWSIDEQSSTDILQSFFKNIKNGHQKDVALRQAKLAYLVNTKANFSHPNFWAGLVLTGNTKAIAFKSSLSGFWWVLGLLLVLFGGYLAYKKFNIVGF